MSAADAIADDSSPRAVYRPLAWLAAAYGAGIAIDRAVQWRFEAGLFEFWWAAAAAALVGAYYAGRRHRDRLAAMLILAAWGAIGGAWHHWRWNYVGGDDLALFARAESQPACVEAVVTDRVRVSPAAGRSPLRAMPARPMSETTMRVLAIRDGVQWRSAGGAARLRAAGELTGLAIGDRVRVFAQLGRQSPPLNPGEYDWAAHQRRGGRFSEIYCDDPRCVSVTTAALASGWSEGLAAVHRWCQRQLVANVAPRDAPLALATLLGDQERLSEPTKEAFLRTGAIHLLVVSGAHVALLAWIVCWVLRGTPLSNGAQLGVTAAAVVVYAGVVGLQPSVTRAAILTIAVAFAFFAGRTPSMGNLLGLAALAVLALNPCELFRSGTQFSFLAVGVLFLVGRRPWRATSQDPLQRLIAETRPWIVRAAKRAGQAWVAVSVASLAVGLALAPLTAYHFHVVTPASILLTPIAGLLVAVALAAGLGTLTVGWLLPPVGWLLGALCGCCLHGTESLVTFAQTVPGSYFYVAGFPWWWLAAFYVAGGLWAAVPNWRPRWPWQAAASSAWLAVGLAALNLSGTPRDALRCTFLAMGHGTCAVLELPGGQTVLYDAGSLNSPNMAVQKIAGYLWSRGISRIDAIVLSHADVDHYNAVPGLVERFPVGAAYISPMMFDPVATDGKLTAPNYLRDRLLEAKTPLREIWLGDRLRTSDPAVTIGVHHPPREGLLARDNANSLLLAIEFAGRRILLPGDLESPGIERVIADPPFDCDILLAPHHGSANSDPPGFAAWCTPEWVVMSGVAADRTIATQRSYQRAGAVVRHTAVNGAVSFTLGCDGSVAVEEFRPGVY